ncbi:MAG: helix-turn-helix domain-containing protein [Pseudomonadota bacterium]
MQQEERRNKTRSAALIAARKLFGARGYDAVTMDDVAQKARIAKGGLYHHFPTKKDLFEAALIEVSSAIAATISQTITPNDRYMEALLGGISIFMEACKPRPTRQILLIDGPSVIGHGRWREIDAENFGALARVAFTGAIEAGEIGRYSVDVLVTLTLGAVTEAVLASPTDKTYEASMKVHLEALGLMLEGLAN